MANPFLNLFKKKENQQIVQRRENTEMESTLDKKNLILKNLQQEDLDWLQYRYDLSLDDITFYFANLLVNNPTLLSYLKDHFIDKKIVYKMNQNQLKICDIQSYYEDKDIFNFPIFSEEESLILEHLNQEIELSNEFYTAFEFSSYEKYLNSSNFINSTISSFFENEEIILEKKKAIPFLKDRTYLDERIDVVIPLEKEKVFQHKIFDFYYSGDLSFQNQTIIFLPYQEFVNWTQSEEKRNILTKCQIVLKESKKFLKITKEIPWVSQFFSDHFNSAPGNQVNQLLVKSNHLLYLIHHSNLGTDLKEYYQYQIGKLMMETDDFWNFYFLETELKKIALEVQKKIKQEKIHHFTEEFNQLELNKKTKMIEIPKFSANIFLHQFENFNQVSSFEVLRKFALLEPEEKNEVLSNKLVIKKLKALLSESADDEYKRYAEIVRTLDMDILLKIFDPEWIQQYFQKNRNQNEYRFFYTILRKDVNQAVKYFLENEDFFNEFIKDIHKYCFDSLEYSLLFKLLKKIEQSNFDIDLSFLGSVNDIEQKNLLSEDFRDDFLVKIVKKCNKEIQKSFYLEDKRFLYLFDKFSIGYLIDNKYKVCEDVLYKNDFFNQFKSSSIIEFRTNINHFLSYQPSLFLEEKIDKYEDELISQYQVKDGLFIPYQNLLENISLLDNRNFIQNGINFFYDSTMNYEIRKYIHYDDEDKSYIDSVPKITLYLQNLSKMKLNELVIDRLFKDNIYNVVLNLKEMLRFEKRLSKKEKILSPEQVLFYEQILNIDHLNGKEILDFYYKFKDKNLSLMFYQDLQKMKKKSYQKIKEDLFQPENKKFLEDKALSEKYGVPVFDLWEKEYVLFARSLRQKHSENSKNRRDCYTLLTHENSTVFSEDEYIYGYSGFDDDCVLHVFEGDSFSADIRNDELNSGSNRVNRIMTSREIATNSSWYSEIQIVNKKNENHPSFFETLKPSFLIVYDEINEKVLNEAKRKNLAISIISHNLNRELEGNIPFNDKLDVYITDYFSLDEFEKRKTR